MVLNISTMTIATRIPLIPLTFLTNTTENKNNISIFYHEDYSSTYSDGLCSFSSDSSYKTHYLLKKGNYQVYHFSATNEATYSGCYWTPDVKCTYTSFYQYANGEIKRERFESVCTPI